MVLQQLRLFLILIFLTLSLISSAQTKTPLLILSNIDGKLMVDGEEKSFIKKNEPYKINVDEGEHILQLIGSVETITEIIECVGNKQRVIKLNFVEDIKINEAITNNDEIIVSNASVSLPGAISDSPSRINKYFTFNKGDEVKFSFDLLNKKGSVNFYFYSYPDDQLIFSRENIQDLDEQTVLINKKGVYRFVFSTNHIFDRDCMFLVKRIPRENSEPNFKTNVVLKWDTTYHEVLDTKVRVYSSTNLYNPNKTVVKVNLPEGTTSWVYWIGVGQESMTQMKNFVSEFSKGAAGLTANPLYAFGIGLIGELPMFKSSATLNYNFADNANSALFLNNPENYQYYVYTFKKGNNVTTDYSIISTIQEELNICFWNMNSFTGHDVQIKVGAFKVTGEYIPE